MKIRAQLAVVFFLLAVVPLSGLVLYSYLGSRQAVREAVAAEANETTRDMNRRMVEIESDLQRRVARLGRLPLASLFEKPESEEGSEELLGRLLAEMGDAAPLVEAFELVAEEADRETLGELLPAARDGDTPVVEVAGEQWLVARSRHPETGLEFGIARPLGEPLAAVRHAAAKNLAYGLGLIALALLGILPLSGRITRKLRLVTEGAERIAAGDLETRVPVGSDDEVGQLARTFNQMARELRDQKERLISEERRRREEEVERQLLEAEYRRKSHELEEARQFQLSLLPQELPTHPAFDLAVHMRTATEVGGDYYDFHLDEDGTLLAVIGDATGHGARAGTMVTVVKSLFSSLPAAGAVDAGDGDGDGDDLARFLAEANRTVRRMRLERMAMALTVVRLHHRRLTVATAGTPPALVYRRGRGEVEELDATGMPLGGLDFPYRQQHLDLEAGDRVLLTTDGFPELLDAGGEPLGYRRARELFAGAAPRESAEEILAELAGAVVERTGGQPPDDDVTFVLIEVR